MQQVAFNDASASRGRSALRVRYRSFCLPPCASTRLACDAKRTKPKTAGSKRGRLELVPDRATRCVVLKVFFLSSGDEKSNLTAQINILLI